VRRQALKKNSNLRQDDYLEKKEFYERGDLRFIIYSRKSVTTKEGDSIENQINDCKRRIFLQYPNASEANITVYQDEGYSGRNTHRPGYQKMLKAIEAGQADIIVCYRLDRLSRSVSDFSNLLKELEEHDVVFISISESFDTTSSFGRAMIQIASVFAQLERETIAERVRDNMHALAKNGQWLGGTPPLGFTAERITKVKVTEDNEEKEKTACKLKVNEEEIETVRIIFEKFLETKSYSAVSKHLLKKGKIPRRGSIFSVSGLKETLQNPVYCTADKAALSYFTQYNANVCFTEDDCKSEYKHGLLAYNKRNHNKKNIPRNPIAKWIIAVGKHRGIISGEDWVKVQKIMEAKKPAESDEAQPAAERNDYALLSGMLRCDKCGSRMFAHLRYPDNPDMFYYICDKKRRGSKSECDGENLMGSETDAKISEYISASSDNNSEIIRHLEKLKREISPEKKNDPLAAINRKIAQNKKDSEKLLTPLFRELANGDLLKRLNEKAAELARELTELEAQQAEIEREQAFVSDKALNTDLIAGALADWRNNPDVLSIHEKRSIIEAIIKKIVWDGEILHIFPYGE
jgi:site-specific DNA recombinase